MAINFNQDPLVYRDIRKWEMQWKQSFSTLLVYMLSCLSHFPLFVTLWTVAHQVPLSMGFSRQESWSELPCPPPGDLPDSGTEPLFLMPPILVGGLLPLVPPGKSLCLFYVSANELADSLPSTVYLYVFFEIYLYTWLCWVRWGTWNL